MCSDFWMQHPVEYTLYSTSDLPNLLVLTYHFLRHR